MKSSNNRGKIFVTAVLAGSLLVGSPAYAESDEQLDVSAGTTPDSVFYTIDQLNERLQLSITSDDEKKRIYYLLMLRNVYQNLMKWFNKERMSTSTSSSISIQKRYQKLRIK